MTRPRRCRMELGGLCCAAAETLQTASLRGSSASKVIELSAPFQAVFKFFRGCWTFVTDASLLAWTRNNCRVAIGSQDVESS
jgi:hypothetical protein